MYHTDYISAKTKIHCTLSIYNKSYEFLLSNHKFLQGLVCFWQHTDCKRHLCCGSRLCCIRFASAVAYIRRNDVTLNCLGAHWLLAALVHKVV